MFWKEEGREGGKKEGKEGKEGRQATERQEGRQSHPIGINEDIPLYRLILQINLQFKRTCYPTIS